MLAGFPCTAGATNEDGFEAMVDEAQTIARCRLRRKPTVSNVHPSKRVPPAGVLQWCRKLESKTE